MNPVTDALRLIAQRHKDPQICLSAAQELVRLTETAVRKGMGLFEDYLQQFREVLRADEISGIEAAIAGNEMDGFEALERVARRLRTDPAGIEAKRILADESEY